MPGSGPAMMYRPSARIRTIMMPPGPVVAGWARTRGGTAWRACVRRGRRFDGLCIQGFVAGVVAALVPFLGLSIAAGAYRV